ncbi:MAG: hypothetical protein ACOYM3_09155 [Terrimicrobiaceae bacterium]
MKIEKINAQGAHRSPASQAKRNTVSKRTGWLRKLFPPLLPLLAAAFLWPAALDAAGTMNILFYGRDGVLMTSSQARQMSNNGTTGYNNDFLLDPVTMRAVSEGTLVNSANGLSFPVPEVPVALALNWPTDPLGYGLVILDNAGRGFTAGGNVNFTYQAALDVRRKLDNALAARPDYLASQKFQSADTEAKTILAGVTATSTESQKGRAGQLALDRLAVAFDTLLAEHGPVQAARQSATNTPWLGVTLAETTNYQANWIWPQRSPSPTDGSVSSLPMGNSRRLTRLS